MFCTFSLGPGSWGSYTRVGAWPSVSLLCQAGPQCSSLFLRESPSLQTLTLGLSSVPRSKAGLCLGPLHTPRPEPRSSWGCDSASCRISPATPVVSAHFVSLPETLVAKIYMLRPSSSREGVDERRTRAALQSYFHGIRIPGAFAQTCRLTGPLGE